MRTPHELRGVSHLRAHMELYYDPERLSKVCTNAKALQRRLGKQNKDRFLQRLQELKASENLQAYLLEGLGHPEQLVGWHVSPSFSVRLTGNVRLVFHPRNWNDNPDFSQCTEIMIEGVLDYHGSTSYSWFIP